MAGHVVYLTSADGAGEPALRAAVTLRVRAYEMASTAASDSSSVAAAVQVLRRYFAALAARDYRGAYAFWDNGAGRTYDAFAASVNNVTSLTAHLGESGRIEGMAGSRYVEIPVVLRTTTASGTERWEGRYALRRSEVPGATAEQHRWRVYSTTAAKR